jgi:hypothetical protein
VAPRIEGVLVTCCRWQARQRSSRMLSAPGENWTTCAG